VKEEFGPWWYGGNPSRKPSKSYIEKKEWLEGGGATVKNVNPGPPGGMVHAGKGCGGEANQKILFNIKWLVGSKLTNGEVRGVR